jgi:hypothetical protein
MQEDTHLKMIGKKKAGAVSGHLYCSNSSGKQPSNCGYIETPGSIVMIIYRTREIPSSSINI